MPTVVCPNCGNKVTFEGIAGVCPNCASVVAVPKSTAPAKPLPPAPRPLSKKPVRVADIEEIGGEPEEVFEPAPIAQQGDGSMDRGVLITIVGAVVVVLVFAIYVMFSGPSKAPPPAPPPAVVATAPPPPPPSPPMPEAPVLPAVPTTHAVLSAGPTWAHLKPVRPVVTADAGAAVSDAAVNSSLTRGANWLVGRYSDGEIPEENGITTEIRPGTDALCTYSLLHCGTAISDQRLNIADPFMQNALEHLKHFDMNTPYATYSHSLRAAALSLFSRPADRTVLSQDLTYLLKSEMDGHYDYTMPPKGAKPDEVQWDHSNSQYGVLGVWAASQAGMSLAPDYWHNVENHWVRTQVSDGGWSYTKNRESTLTMTCAGITTLSVAAEQQVLLSTGKMPAHVPLTNALRRGLEWLGANDRIAGDFDGYTLYGVERAALATGLKRFGTHDWYRELSKRVIASQGQNGSWSGRLPQEIETPFHLLFLARGRQALAVNKLRFAGEWNNRPRDASKLAEYASMQLEQPFAWGVADFSREWSDWIDCAMLLISTDTPPAWSEADFAKLRQYSDAGGMILLHNENATPEMDAFAEQLAKQAYPEFPLVDLPPDHLLYSVVYPMKKKTPLKGVSNGHRLLMVYSPTDITKGWLIRQGRGTNEQAQLGLNLFVYAAGKTNFHGRLITPYIPPPLFAALGSIPIARIKYTGGNWDPEPFAWQRFPRWFQEQTSIALSVTPQAIEELNFPAVPVAVLTGDSAVDFDKMNLQPLHDYVAAGGLVVIDSVAGNQPFIQSVRDKLLPKAFADGQIQQLDTSHPLLAGTGDGMDPLPKAQLRQFAIEQLGHNLPALDIVTLGKGAVIISDIDLTCGLLDTSTWGITGYEPNYCNSLVKNVILWASERYHL